MMVSIESSSLQTHLRSSEEKSWADELFQNRGGNKGCSGIYPDTGTKSRSGMMVSIESSRLQTHLCFSEVKSWADGQFQNRGIYKGCSGT